MQIGLRPGAVKLIAYSMHLGIASDAAFKGWGKIKIFVIPSLDPVGARNLSFPAFKSRRDSSVAAATSE